MKVGTGLAGVLLNKRHPDLFMHFALQFLTHPSLISLFTDTVE